MRLLQGNRDRLDHLAQALLEPETLDEDAAYAGVGAVRQGAIGRGIRRRRVHHVGVAPGAATRIAASFFAHDL